MGVLHSKRSILDQMKGAFMNTAAKTKPYNPAKKGHKNNKAYSYVVNGNNMHHMSPKMYHQ